MKGQTAQQALSRTCVEWLEKGAGLQGFQEYRRDRKACWPQLRTSLGLFLR